MMTSPEMMPSVAQKIEKQKKQDSRGKGARRDVPLPSLSAFQFLNDLMAPDLFPGVSSKLL
jgi:hypothetical protein